MFYNDEEIDVEFKDLPHMQTEHFSFVTNDNDDPNLTYYEMLAYRTYSRWKFHWLITLSFLYLLSLNYPFIFMFIFFDLFIIQALWLRSKYLFLVMDDDYDISYHNSQRKGGDHYLDIFIFFCYDRLGYIIFEIADTVHINVSSDIYHYNNHIGLYDNLKIYKKKKLWSKRKLFDKLDLLDNLKLRKEEKINKKKFIKRIIDIKKIKKKKLYDIKILNSKAKFNLNINNLKLKELYFIIHFNNRNIKKKKKKKNYFFILLNPDRCFSFFDLINPQNLKTE